MEPLYFHYPAVNRTVVILKPKQAFFDWINKTFPKDEPVTSLEENNVYLVKERDSNQDVLNRIKRNFNRFFENELNDWHTDETTWPQKRTYIMFSEWFDVEINSMVLDMEEGPILKEE